MQAPPNILRELKTNPGCVHLWLLAPSPNPAPAHIDALGRWMNEAERAREQRFVTAALGLNHRLARALVRGALAFYAPVQPVEWTFVEGPQGKPAICPDTHPDHGGLCFNLSHAEGLMALAVAWERPVGVDVEHLGRRANMASVARLCFAPEEWQDVQARPALAQRARFLWYWTLKEAYIKARGEGMSLPVQQVVFAPGPGEEGITPKLGPALVDDPARWHFESLKPDPEHILAIALGRSPGALEALKIEVFRLDEQALACGHPAQASPSASAGDCQD